MSGVTMHQSTPVKASISIRALSYELDKLQESLNKKTTPLQLATKKSPPPRKSLLPGQRAGPPGTITPDKSQYDRDIPAAKLSDAGSDSQSLAANAYLRTSAPLPPSRDGSTTPGTSTSVSTPTTTAPQPMARQVIAKLDALESILVAAKHASQRSAGAPVSPSSGRIVRGMLDTLHSSLTAEDSQANKTLHATKEARAAVLSLERRLEALAHARAVAWGAQPNPAAVEMDKLFGVWPSTSVDVRENSAKNAQITTIHLPSESVSDKVAASKEQEAPAAEAAVHKQREQRSRSYSTSALFAAEITAKPSNSPSANNNNNNNNNATALDSPFAPIGTSRKSPRATMAAILGKEAPVFSLIGVATADSHTPPTPPAPPRRRSIIQQADEIPADGPPDPVRSPTPATRASIASMKQAPAAKPSPAPVADRRRSGVDFGLTRLFSSFRGSPSASSVPAPAATPDASTSSLPVAASVSTIEKSEDVSPVKPPISATSSLQTPQATPTVASIAPVGTAQGAGSPLTSAATVVDMTQSATAPSSTIREGAKVVEQQFTPQATAIEDSSLSSARLLAEFGTSRAVASSPTKAGTGQQLPISVQPDVVPAAAAKGFSSAQVEVLNAPPPSGQQQTDIPTATSGPQEMSGQTTISEVIKHGADEATIAGSGADAPSYVGVDDGDDDHEAAADEEEDGVDDADGQLTNVDIDFILHLVQGFNLLKHCRRGWPHQRLLWLDLTRPDLTICWGRPELGTGNTAAEGFLISEIERVTTGICSEILKRSASKKSANKVFSFWLRDRTLDFECESEQQCEQYFGQFARILSHVEILQEGLLYIDDNKLWGGAGVTEPSPSEAPQGH